MSMEMGNTGSNQPEVHGDSSHIEVASPTHSKAKKNPLGFLWRHKLVVTIVIAVLLALLVVFSIIPVVPVGGSKLVNLGTEFKLEKDQVAIIKYSGVSVKLVNFSNIECPVGETCYGSESTVEYQLSVGNKKYATGSEVKAAGAKYQIETVSTDHKTYADIKIIKSNN